MARRENGSFTVRFLFLFSGGGGGGYDSIMQSIQQSLVIRVSLVRICI